MDNIKLRPNASAGLWLSLLLPTAILWSIIKNPIVTTPLYKSVGICTIGILLSALNLIRNYPEKLHVHRNVSVIIAIFLVALNYFLHVQDVLIGILSGFTCTFGFYNLYLWLLRTFPCGFTLGEAALVAQGATLFLYSSLINIAYYFRCTCSQIQVCTIVLQIGLLGISYLCLIMYKCPKLRSPFFFYLVTGTCAIFLTLLPLYVLLRKDPIVWVISFLLDEPITTKLFVYWLICTIVAVLLVQRHIKNAKHASTGVRKIFHLLAVAVFLPGLLYRCSLLYLASGVAFAFFILLEMIRILNVPPLGDALQQGFLLYRDEKDEGPVALTGIYLLVGCSLPLWIHPAPCDLLDSARQCLLPMMSGLLSIGIGDTAASIVGSSIGKNHWRGSKKTIEGTIACILSQLLVVYLLMLNGSLICSTEEILQVVAAITITALIEAKTDQIDNLVLPLVLFTLLV